MTHKNRIITIYIISIFFNWEKKCISICHVESQILVRIWKHPFPNMWVQIQRKKFGQTPCREVFGYSGYCTVWLISVLIWLLTMRIKSESIQQGKSEGFDSCDRPSNLTQIGFKSSIFQPLWPWNLMDDQKNKNNRAPLLCYFKLFASFHSHWWIQTGVTVRKPLIWVNIDTFLAVWPWNLMNDLQKQ